MAAIALVLASNGIALIEVARNRAGEPVRAIELTERELPLPGIDQDNTGIDLRINWSRPLPPHSDSVLDRARLEKIGFDFRVPSGMQPNELALLPREAFVVLEYQGDVRKQLPMLSEEERRQNPSDATAARVPVSESRLFVVDVSPSLEELSARYPDAGKYMIVRGVVRAQVEIAKGLPAGAPEFRYTGFVAQILPPVIHVPLPHAAVLRRLGPRQPGQEARYAVTLQFGRRLEPWVAAVRPLR